MGVQIPPMLIDDDDFWNCNNSFGPPLGVTLRGQREHNGGGAKSQSVKILLTVRRYGFHVVSTEFYNDKHFVVII